MALESFEFQYRDRHRCVGGYIGTDAARHDWLEPHIQKWIYGVKALARVATRFPQTAYAGMVKSLQSFWKSQYKLVFSSIGQIQCSE
jgi:hypothetical protein